MIAEIVDDCFHWRDACTAGDDNQFFTLIIGKFKSIPIRTAHEQVLSDLVFQKFPW